MKLLIEIVASRPNIKARIQAVKALLAYKTLYDLGGGSTQALIDTFDAVIVCMGYKTHFAGSTAELKYLDDFEDVVLDLWLSASEMLIASAQNDAADKTIQDYLNSNSTFLLLQNVTDYLRKELEVPKYSGMFENEAEFV